MLQNAFPVQILLLLLLLFMGWKIPLIKNSSREFSFLLASCELPQIDRGTYGSRYRPGMVVGHGTEADYHCNGEFQKMAPGGPAKCHLGEWRPNKPACFHPSYIHGMKNFSHDKDNKVITSIRRSCGLPQKEKGAIFYVEGKPIDFDTDFLYVHERIRCDMFI